MYRLLILISLLIANVTCSAANPNPLPRGKVEHHTLKSVVLADNRVGLDPARNISVYLPPGYAKNKRHYPVLYYIPHGRQMLDDRQVTGLFDTAIAENRMGAFILVSGDFGIPDSINFFGNGPTTGRWLDHIKGELVPFIDQHYRTLSKPAARGISGHYLGGYAAFKLAMFHPDIFGSVYALHPVATDTGETSSLYIPNWKEIHAAKSLAELKAPYSLPFVAMAQAHLPNPQRPPFYADFIVEMIDGELVPNQANIYKLKSNFHLADLLPRHAANLGKLRGIAFDWGRKDANQSHVYGARKFSKLLDDFGIAHDAEEHGGNGWDYDFTKEGRIYWNLLPFFNRHLEFE